MAARVADLKQALQGVDPAVLAKAVSAFDSVEVAVNAAMSLSLEDQDLEYWLTQDPSAFSSPQYVRQAILELFLMAPTLAKGAMETP